MRVRKLDSIKISLPAPTKPHSFTISPASRGLPVVDIGSNAMKHVMANEIIIQALKNRTYTLFNCIFCDDIRKIKSK